MYSICVVQNKLPWACLVPVGLMCQCAGEILRLKTWAYSDAFIGDKNISMEFGRQSEMVGVMVRICHEKHIHLYTPSAHVLQQFFLTVLRKKCWCKKKREKFCKFSKWLPVLFKRGDQFIVYKTKLKRSCNKISFS